MTKARFDFFGVGMKQKIQNSANWNALTGSLSRFFGSIVLFAFFGSMASGAAPCRQLLRKALSLKAPEIAENLETLKRLQGPKRSLESLETLKVGTLNSYNLYVTTGKYETQVNPKTGVSEWVRVTDSVSKSSDHLRSIAGAIQNEKLDIVVLQEVEGIESLLKFNHEFLDGEFEVFLVRGNDFRGIDVAMLVRKDLPFRFEYESHADALMPDPIDPSQKVPAFSRDLPVLKVFKDSGGKSGSDEKPMFAILGTHFKSKRDRPGDVESRQLRRAQVEQSAKIIDQLQKTYGENFPILFAGDFNGHVHFEEEFEILFEQGLKLSDTLRVANPELKSEDAVTHTWHPSGQDPSYQQLDAIFVNGPFKPWIKRSEVYRYKDAAGNPKPLPTTRYQRDKNPSDHFPVWAEIDFRGLAGFLGIF